MYVLEFPDDRVASEKNRAKERCLVLVVYPGLNCFLMNAFFCSKHLHRCWPHE